MGVDARAHGSRATVLIGIVLIAILGVDRAGADSLRIDTSPHFPVDHARYFSLPQAQVALSSSSEDDLLVRWGDLGSHTWTEPKVAYRAGARTLTSMQFRAGMSTVTLVATFTLPETDFTNALVAEGLAADDVTVVLVCGDQACTPSREYPGSPGTP